MPPTELKCVRATAGIDRVTANFASGVDAGCVDGCLTGDDREAVEMAYYCLRNEGIFVGPSAALNVVGAVKLARRLPRGSTVVTVLSPLPRGLGPQKLLLGPKDNHTSTVNHVCVVVEY